MLFVAGAFDSVSVIVRGSIVQLVTPDEMRGRGFRREQYLHWHIERIRRARIRAHRRTVRTGAIGCRWRNRNDSRCHRGRDDSAGNAQDRSAG